MTELSREIDMLSTSALWYAWGQMDPSPGELAETNALRREGFNLDHGHEFQRLYQQVATEYRAGDRGSRISLLDAWRLFVDAKRVKGLVAVLTVDDIERN
jgi:hypothetical protein